jgi:hypothetical protein
LRGRSTRRRLALCLLGLVAALALSSAPALGAIKHPFVTSFGSFAHVGGVAVDQATGDVYVLDTEAEGGSLLKFSATGEPLKFAGLPGEPLAVTGLGAGGQSENELAVDSSSGPAKGDVYVAVSGGGGDVVEIIAPDGTSLGTLSEATAPWGTVCGVATDPSGNVYVSLYGPIDKFTPQANPATNADFVASMSGANEACNVAADSGGNAFGATWPEGPVWKFPSSDFGSSASGTLVDGSGSSLAADPSDDHIYVNSGSRVSEFGPHGEPASLPISTFGETGEGAITGSEGIAVNASTGDVYVPDGQGHLSVFGPGLPAPTVITGGVSSFTGHSANVTGSVNPEGSAVTECKVEYGTDRSYASSAPCAANPGSGESPVAVSAEISGLKSDTYYHYRIVATNAAGEEAGSDETFTTAQAVVTGEASAIAEEGATLAGRVNPEGLTITGCDFQYGFSKEYGQSAPCVSLPGSGNEPVSVAATLSNLTPNGKYHYRLVIANANGENFGQDQTLTTPGSLATGVNGLPDGRIYEMVTNPDGGNGEVYEPAGSPEFSNAETENPFQASDSGGGIAYVGSPDPAEGGNEAAGYDSGNEYLATRMPSGWTQTDISPVGFPSALFQGFSNDLSVGFLDSLEGITPDAPGFGQQPPYGGSYDMPYTMDTSGGGNNYIPLVTAVPPYRSMREFQTYGIAHPAFGGPGGRNYNNRMLGYAGASADSSHILFEANDSLTPNAEGGPESRFNEENNLYEYESGALRLVNVRPDGSTSADATFGSALGNAPDFSHVISEDGSRIFWSDLKTGHIYVRENDATTVEVSPAGQYWTATSDGSKAFYTNGDLYVYDVETGTTDDLTPGVEVQGVVGASENGEYVYFITSSFQLELWHNGTVTMIKTLTARDNSEMLPYNFNAAGDWKAGYANRMAEVSPDGRAMVFMSDDREQFQLGSVEVYEAETNKVYCASCGSGGSRGFVPLTYSNTYLKRWISEDGSRVFFDSPQALVPQDGNGKLDVYEWERAGTGSCESSSGCIYLLSGGTSQDESYLADASPSGDDVFIITRAKLSSRDDNEKYDLYDVRVGGAEPVATPACTGAGCQGPPAAPPIFSTPSSFTFEGVGNFSAPASAVKPKLATKPEKKKKKAKPKCKRKKGRRAARQARCIRSHKAKKGARS